MSTADASTIDAAVPSHLGRRVIARLIDDTVLIALMIVLVLRVFAELGTGGPLPTPLGGFGQSESGWTAYAPLSDEGNGHPGLSVLFGGLLSGLVFAVYALWSSGTSGATFGRAVAGIRVVAADGAPAKRRLIAGRELVRVATIAVGLSFATVVSWPVTSAGASVFGTTFSTEVAQVQAAAALLPLGVVIAGLLGAAMVHPEGRALHDRWSRTRVVRARDLDT